MMKVLVIIVTYNGMQWLNHCLGSLRQSSVPTTIFIVDNGSTDNTQLFIKNNYPEVLFHQSESNIGFGKANNWGLQYALDEGYDYVYLLNQDAWILPETISSLIKLSQKHPEYGILSPFQMSADVHTIDKSFASRLKTWESYYPIISDFYNNNVEDVYEAERVMAAHWFMTRECIEKVGGFSPSFPHYGEDDNYSQRVKYKGLKIGVVPQLKVVHDRQWRKVETKKRIYQNYTEWIFKLSSPYSKPFPIFISIIRPMISSIVRFKSSLPFVYFLKLISNYRLIIKNRKISMVNDCAFLKKTYRK